MLRLHMLGFTAWANTDTAGLLAMDLPDLVGPDPRTEPAACQTSPQWVADARELVHQEGGETSTLRNAHDGDLPTMSHDARELLDAIAEGAKQVGCEWDVRRLAGAAAEAAASVLIAFDATPDQFIAAFAGLGAAPVGDAAAEFLDS